MNEKSNSKKKVLIFVLYFAGCMAAGFVGGLFIGRYVQSHGIRNVYARLGSFYNIIAGYAGFAVIIFTGFYLLFQIIAYHRIRRKIDSIDLESEEAFDYMDQRLSNLLVLGNVGLFGVELLGGISFYNMMSRIKEQSVMMIFAILAYLAGIITVIVFQKKIMNLAKRLYPEKTVSSLDLHFQKKWMQQCDEAERFQIYQAGFQAFQCMNSFIYPILSIALLITGMVFEIGLLPFILVVLLWMISNFSYMSGAKKAIKRLS